MVAETTDSARAYCMEGAGGEHMLVIRTHDVEMLQTLVRRMGRMRDDRLRAIGRALEEELHGKH